MQKFEEDAKEQVKKLREGKDSVFRINFAMQKAQERQEQLYNYVPAKEDLNLVLEGFTAHVNEA